MYGSISSIAPSRFNSYESSVRSVSVKNLYAKRILSLNSLLFKLFEESMTAFIAAALISISVSMNKLFDK
jgi:hypothetical protein